MAKILGMQPRTAAIAIGGSALVAGGYLWWRKRQQGTQPAAAATASTGCTDGSGNSVPCPDGSSTDVQGELSVVQTELESLLSAEGTEAGTTTTATSTSTSTGPPGAPTGLTITSITQSGFKATWHAPAKTAKGAVAVSYTYDIEQGGKLIKSATTPALGVAATGLKRNTAYTFFVRACNHPGCSPSVSAPVKTKA